MREQQYRRPNLKTLFLAARPEFFTASAAPVLVGTAAGFAVADNFEALLFVLALGATMALHAGANIANDYFDHISGNDWVNRNPTPFSGGRRFIQEGILSPRATLFASLFALVIGCVLGGAILLMTRSALVLILGLIGLLGGFFYTAPPIKLGYRCVGEIVIAFLFGILPVYGAYYLQIGVVDAQALVPAMIAALLIFLVILINEFPDAPADGAVGKKTLVVHLGVRRGVWIYRAALTASYMIAAVAMLAGAQMFWAGLFYLFTSPLGVAAFRFANPKDLSTQGPTQHRASAFTILLHLLGSIALTIGLLVAGIRD